MIKKTKNGEIKDDAEKNPNTYINDEKSLSNEKRTLIHTTNEHGNSETKHENVHASKKLTRPK